MNEITAFIVSRVRLFATPWTVAYQTSPSMGFFRQEYWSGLPFPSPRDLPDQGSNPDLLHCTQTLYPLSHQGSPIWFLDIWLITGKRGAWQATVHRVPKNWTWLKWLSTHNFHLILKVKFLEETVTDISHIVK